MTETGTAPPNAGTADEAAPPGRHDAGVGAAAHERTPFPDLRGEVAEWRTGFGGSDPCAQFSSLARWKIIDKLQAAAKVLLSRECPDEIRPNAEASS